MIVNHASPEITVRDSVLELVELPYDRLKLVEIFEQTRQSARVKGLPWDSVRGHIKPDNCDCVTIQHDDHMIHDPEQQGGGIDLLDFEYIRELIRPFKFSHDITAGNVDIIWNKPGFRFVPHVDHYSMSTVMWPILSDGHDYPVDFYHRPGLEFKIPNNFPDMTQAERFYSHTYSTQYPTIFNSHVIHGVRQIAHDRAHLRLRINQDFVSIRERYLAGTLLEFK